MRGLYFEFRVFSLVSGLVICRSWFIFRFRSFLWVKVGWNTDTFIRRLRCVFVVALKLISCYRDLAVCKAVFFFFSVFRS